MSGPVVVVGGGLAGGTLATELRERGHDGPVTVVCDEPHPPYERPPLTKSFLRGESAAEDAYVRPAAWYAEHDVTLVTGAVQQVDLATRRARTDRGDELDYETLVLATGSRARRLPLASSPEVAVHHLRDLADAAALRSELGDGRRLLVVGGGWIGLEVAASARMVGAEVTLVEPTEQPLSGTLGVEVGSWFAELHRGHGVDLRTGVGISGLEGREAVLGDGSRLEVDLVVVGIGAVPNDDLARAAGLDVGDGVLVDAGLRTSDPAVLAIGDVASHLHPVLGERVRVEHWQNARSQGQVAARVIAGEGVVHDELPSFFSDQYDAGLEFFGHLGRAPAEVTVERTAAGLLAWWHRDGRLVAAAHVNEWDRSKELAQRVQDGA
jgi:3-phenylpropionate/trans-cinnamate dioxygenase ferredoxin reductase subunit